MAKAYLQQTSQPTPQKMAPGATVSTPTTRKHSTAEGVAILGVGAAAIGFGIWELWHGGGSAPGSPAGCGGYVPTPFTLVQTTEADGTVEPVMIVDQNLVGHPISSQETAAACGYELDEVAQLTPIEYGCITKGSAVTGGGNCYAGPGQLIQTTSADGTVQPVCVIDGSGIKHPIPSATVAGDCGYNLSYTIQVTPYVYDAIPNGSAVGSGNCYQAYNNPAIPNPVVATDVSSASGGPGRSGQTAGPRRRR